MDCETQLPPITILVVDDHGIVRDGLRLILDGHPRLKVVGAAANGRQAVQAALLLEPDVIIMDLVMPELSGTDATVRILETVPQTRVIALSACDTFEHVLRAFRAGARGYVLKESASAELVLAVLCVARNERYLSPRISGVLIDGLLDHSAPQLTV
jgi:DNA-binding NarL/FixJ family response regulator